MPTKCRDTSVIEIQSGKVAQPPKEPVHIHRKATSDVVWVRGQYSTYIIYSAGFSHRFEIAKLDRFKDMLELTDNALPTIFVCSQNV